MLTCKFLTRPVKTALELQKVDLMLMQFCEKFEQLYGKSKVKPNMHLHGHLKECVLDYGPIYNFWCFSFERFNGTLSSFKNAKIGVVQCSNLTFSSGIPLDQ